MQCGHIFDLPENEWLYLKHFEPQLYLYLAPYTYDQITQNESQV